MKVFYIAGAAFVALFLSCSGMSDKKEKSTFYDLSFKSLDGGKMIKMSEFKGKKILVVNTASECGYTPQYEQLEALSKKYADKLVIVGFPTNDFGGQEPGTNEEIAQFCKKNYGVTFPMSEKVTVRGEGMNAVYQWLTHKDKNGVEDSEVKWNFQKYLIDEEGNYVAMFTPRTKPDEPEVIKAIED